MSDRSSRAALELRHVGDSSAGDERELAIEIAQRVLDQRGYLIVSTFDVLKVGDVLVDVNWALNPRYEKYQPGYKLVVIAETDRADSLEQARICGFDQWLNPNVPNYYRVVAE